MGSLANGREPFSVGLHPEKARSEQYCAGDIRRARRAEVGYASTVAIKLRSSVEYITPGTQEMFAEDVNDYYLGSIFLTARRAACLRHYEPTRKPKYVNMLPVEHPAAYVG